uniref:Uncharacterized protein n=1 Tax=Utricularia reniformis TaxID=192314 RepID=A0A1Y0B3B2_9LAMI|nr:hypothetical protein AEK19_MT1710 [Utricularia reniformis]ART31890.1 hypothetical protein AEK19_MT1710 [Utricularia reniformis]
MDRKVLKTTMRYTLTSFFGSAFSPGLSELSRLSLSIPSECSNNR